MNQFVRISRKNSRYFEYEDGTPFVPVGMNLCFERFSGDDAEILAIYRRWFRRFSENGGNFARIWLGVPFLNLEPEKPGVFSERKLSEIVADFPPIANLSCRFDVPPIRSRAVLAELTRRYRSFAPMTFDGLRFDLPEGRVLVRSSNTEPILRLNVECASRPEAEALLARFKDEIQPLTEDASRT